MEANGKATVGEAAGVVSKAELEIVRGLLVEEVNKVSVLLVDVRDRDRMIAERDAALAAAREALAAAEKLRDEAVREACAEKAAARDAQAMVALRESQIETMQEAQAHLTVEKRDLWAKLKARDDRVEAWQQALERLAAQVGVGSSGTPDEIRNRCALEFEKRIGAGAPEATAKP